MRTGKIGLYDNGMKPIESAIAAVGGIKALARLLDIRYQAVQQWVRRGRPPAERCLEIERVSGVSRYALRPDVYGPANERKTA